jgi:hypothetical protein
MKQQFAGLQRRTTGAGRDSVDHGVGGHDDLANACAGAIGRVLESGDEGGLVTWFKLDAAGAFDERRKQSRWQRLRKTLGLGAVNQPMVSSTEIPSVPSSCPRCGATGVIFEPVGTGSSLRFRCPRCTRYFDGVATEPVEVDDRTKCPKCGRQGQVIGGQLICNQDLTQWWPNGAPEIPYATFKNLKRGRGLWN